MTAHQRARRQARRHAHATRQDARRPAGTSPSADELRVEARNERRGVRRVLAGLEEVATAAARSGKSLREVAANVRRLGELRSGA